MERGREWKQYPTETVWRIKPLTKAHFEQCTRTIITTLGRRAVTTLVTRNGQDLSFESYLKDVFFCFTFQPRKDERLSF